MKKKLYVNILDRYVSQINNLQAPGMPTNLSAIFTKQMTKDKLAYTEQGIMSIEDYINKIVMPYVFMNGIFLTGMTHGNFITARDYEKPESIVTKKLEDYDANVDLLNYLFACMAAAEDARTYDDQTIKMVSYWGEADFTAISTFKNMEEFASAVEEELKDLEEYEEEEE